MEKKYTASKNRNQECPGEKTGVETRASAPQRLLEDAEDGSIADSALVDALIDEARSPLVLVDDGLAIVNINEPATLLFGKGETMLRGRTVGEAISPELQRLLRENADRLRLAKDLVLDRVELEDRDGNLRSFSVCARYLGTMSRSRIRYLIAWRAEEGSSQESLPARDVMLAIRRVIGSFPESILIIDMRTVVIIECNAIAQAKFGYSREELIGREPRLLVTDEEHALLRASVGSYERQGFFQGKILCRRKDGSCLAMMATILGIVDSSNRLKYVLAIGRDLSDEERGYRELLALTERSKASIDEMEARLRLFVAPKPETRLSDLGFSPKQVRIAALLCAGEPNKRIAALLETSDSTIKSHIHAMYVKLGVSSKIEFVNYLRGKNITIE